MALSKTVAWAAMMAARLAVAALALPSTPARRAAPARHRAHLHARTHVQALSSEGDEVDHPAWCKSMDAVLRTYEQAGEGPTSRAGEAPRLEWDDIVGAVQQGTSRNTTANVESWMGHKCDATLWTRFLAVAPFPTCTPDAAARSATQHPSCAGYRTCTQQYAKYANRTPHIAIMLGSTSKKVASPSTDSMALFTMALPSIAKTVECGFRYTVFVGYDAEDPFYDTGAGEAALNEWFGRHVETPLAERGIAVAIEAVRVENDASKPGPVFNALARHAQARDADFFYRVNDDTLMVTPWASAFVCALCSFGAPYGVVGPVESIRADILTHDFVHRTHLAIFDDYYPPDLSDWWMDDWISQVYGPARSVKVATVKVRRGRKVGRWRAAPSVDRALQRVARGRRWHWRRAPIRRPTFPRFRHCTLSTRTAPGTRSTWHTATYCARSWTRGGPASGGTRKPCPGATNSRTRALTRFPLWEGDLQCGISVHARWVEGSCWKVGSSVRSRRVWAALRQVSRADAADLASTATHNEAPPWNARAADGGAGFGPTEAPHIFAGTGPTENSQQRLDFANLPFPFAGLPPTTSIHATNVSQRVPGRDRARRVVAGGRRGTGGARWSDPGVVVVSRRCKARRTRQHESTLRTGTKGGEVAPVQG